MVEVLTQAEVEHRIIRLSDELEELTELFVLQSQERAEAESDYKYKHARALIEQSGKVTVSAREAVAHLRAANDFRTWKLCEAKEKATQSKMTAIRSQLDALRTIAANVRHLTR